MKHVAVIGAGPAGVSAAMYLKQKGYQVTVFERESTVGGKCHNLQYGGRAYDLGANLITDRYTTVRPIAEELGLGFYRFPSLQMIDLATGLEPTMARLNPAQKLLIRVFAQWYVRVWNRTTVDQNGYAGYDQALRVPFREWLANNRMAGMREAFANYFIAYGYGVMDDLPAAYALKFFDPVHFLSAIDISLGARVPTMDMVRGGYQAIWDGVVRRDGIDVRLQSAVTSVDRSGPKVAMTWDHEGATHTGEFDKLVLACPFDTALGFLDGSEAENRLFRKIHYYDYHVTAARLEGVPRVATFLHPYAKVFTPGQPTVFYAPHASEGDDVFLFYAYGGSGTTDEYVKANIERVIEGNPFNGRVGEFIASKTWRYFPHVSTETMKAGFFDEIDAMQGKNNTFYVGEVLSFPLVELCARFSKEVVHRHF